MVPQFDLSSTQALMAKLHRSVAAGGEGLMLYRAGRRDDLLKPKPYQDAEAK